jgi:hypothetical protein
MKYDLAKMLAEIKRDERAGKGPGKEKVLTQAEIKARARNRRKTDAGKPPPK